MIAKLNSLHNQSLKMNIHDFAWHLCNVAVRILPAIMKAIDTDGSEITKCKLQIFCELKIVKGLAIFT